MTKIFPKSRICVIDIYPSFEKGLKLAINFASKYNISLNSADGRRTILAFCLHCIETTYKNTSSPFPKVICISKKAISKRVSLFIDNYFENALNQLPIPYCGKIDLVSPDLETAAELSLKQQKPQRKYKEFISMLKIKTEVPLRPILP
jgi:hypothetical protein